MKKNKNIKKKYKDLPLLVGLYIFFLCFCFSSRTKNEQKQKIKDHRKEYYKRYYIEKKLAIKEYN